MKIPLNFNQKGGAIALLLLVPTLVLIAIFSNPKNFNSLKKVVLNFLPITIFASSGPDLSVSFIERTLRFERYNVTYPNDYPRLVSGTEGYQRWPTAGQTVKFTASIKNAGTASSSATIYRWFIDNQEVKKGTLDGLAQGENKKEELDWSWQDGDHTVKFIVDPDNNLTEISKQNNQLEDRTNSLSFRIHVDKTVYDKFNSFLNIIGTYSFEDWIQQHIKAFNQKIESSGGKTRIRVDQISVEPDHLTDPGGTHAPMDMEWDGRWGFVMPDWCKSVDCPDRPDGINYWVTKIQPSLLHEWSHQIGMAHSYDANVDIASNNLISGTRLIQKNPDIVGTGGDDVGGAFEQNKPLTPYFIFALDSTLGFRRGYYAEYLFDTPDQNIVSFKDAFSNPLTNAQVKVWQKQDGKVSGEPMLTGSTDSNGNFSLPNKPIPEGNLTTATGHTLKANPFGQIKVVGQNGLFLFEIQKEGQIDYQILTIHDFNLAYFKGAKASANYTLKTAIVSNANPTNLMLKKPASASTNDSQAYMAVDGDKTSIDTGYWSPANAQGNIGDFLKVDLGASNSLYKIIVYASAQNGHDMYQQFHIEVSETGQFSGEAQTVVRETSWDNSRAGTNKVSYIFNPVKARFVRLVADQGGAWMRLQEIEGYGLNDTDTTAPIVSITNPQNGATVSRRSTINITANATDNVGVTKVEFYINGVLKCTDSTSTYSCSWNVPNKRKTQYTLQAKAYDKSGNTSTSTITVKTP